MSKQKLTPRQTAVLAVIDKYISDNGYSPALRDLANIMGMAGPTGVMYHLGALEKKGVITRGEAGMARAIRITTLGRQHLESCHPQKGT